MKLQRDESETMEVDKCPISSVVRGNSYMQMQYELI